MRSAIHHSFGNPADVLACGDSPKPEPKSGEARIRMVMAPIHNHDLWTIRGEYGYKPPLPAIGGSEAMGVVDAIGPDTQSMVQVGQRVAVAGVHGAWAEYFIAPVQALVPLPEAVSDEVGAQLIAMPSSALMLIDFLGLEKGDWFVQNAANGLVGKIMAMLAAARGLNCINLVRRDEGVAEMTAMGLGNAVSTAAKGWKEQVAALTNGAPIKAGIDSVGGSASGHMLSILGEGATLVSFGSMTGEPMQVSSGDLIFRQATIKGFWAYKANRDMSLQQKIAMIGELLRLVISGALKLDTDAVFALEDCAKAAAASLRPGRKGKILLKA